MNISQDNKDINGKENEDSLSGIKYLLIENKILDQRVDQWTVLFLELK